MKEILTFHGILGLIRILLSPLVPYLVFIGNSFLAGIIFFIAASTDFIDSLLVKEHKHNMEFSYFWDGFSDRVLILFGLMALIIRGLGLFAIMLIVLYVIGEAIIGTMITLRKKKFYLFHKHRFSARLNIIIVLIAMGVFIITNEYELFLVFFVLPFLIYLAIDYLNYYRNV